MAIYNIVIKTVSRSAGHSATAKIAYNSRGKIKDLRTGQIFNYNSPKLRAELLHSEITCGDLTLNNAEREKLWNTAELTDNRSNSRTAREYVLALPKELTLKQNVNLVREFSKDLTVKYGHVADWSIHDEKADNENIHVHILTTTRKFDPVTKLLGNKTDLELENGALKKQNKPITQDQIKEIRKNWEVTLNKHLKLAGHDLVVSCEKKEDRELVKKHLGKNATALERKGIQTDLGNYNRTIDELLALNQQIFSDGAKLAQARAELAILEQQGEQERQKQAELSKAEQIRQEHLQVMRQLELNKLEREKVEKAKKQKEKEEQEDLAKLQEKIRQEKFVEVEAMYITGKYSNPLFNVAAAYGEFFTSQGNGNYTSRDGSVTINPERVNVHKYSEDNVRLCLDVAVIKFSPGFVLHGSDNFIKSAIEELAINPRYANIILNNKEQQEMLESRKLDIEISSAPDLDLDSFDLDATLENTKSYAVVNEINLKQKELKNPKAKDLVNDYDFEM